MACALLVPTYFWSGDCDEEEEEFSKQKFDFWMLLEVITHWTVPAFYKIQIKKSHLQTYMDALSTTCCDSKTERRWQRHHGDLSQTNHFLYRGLEAVRGGLSVHVCSVVPLYTHMQIMGQIWGSICSSFPSFRQQQTPFIPSFHSVSLTLSQSVFLSEHMISRDGRTQSESFQHTHRHMHTQVGPCVFFTSVCLLPLQTLVTRGHWQCASRAGLGWGQRVWVDSQNSVYSQMWTEEHCQAQVELFPSFPTISLSLCVWLNHCLSSPNLTLCDPPHRIYQSVSVHFCMLLCLFWPETFQSQTSIKCVNLRSE